MVDPTFAAPLLEMGLPGTIILALAWAYWKRSEKVDEIMEKRVEEGRETIEALNQSTTAMLGFTSKLEDLKRFLEVSNRGGA